MSRRRFLTLLATAAAAGAALYLAGRARQPPPASQAAARPALESPGPPITAPPIPRQATSLVLITLDTTRADHLGPYGAQDVETPALDALAAEGIVFERAFAVAPITLVAHASLFTGLYPPQHGVRHNGIHFLPAPALTLAERLRDQGYRTAAFVSAAVLERRYGLAQGFEVYDDDLSAGRDRHPRMVADRPAIVTVGAASAWLDQVGPEERFFLWVHLYDPHAPYSPPAPYRDHYAERLYDGEIAFADHQIDRLLRHPRIDMGRRCVVTAIGDHGESLGEHGEQTHGLLAYDATLRIPWILRAPQGPRGLRVQPVVSQVDLVPTLLDLLGFEADKTLAGHSVLPPFDQNREDYERTLYSESYLPFYVYGWAKLRVLRRGPWKYIDAPRPELYGMKRDPRELSNQFEPQPGLAHDLRRELERLDASFGDAVHEAELPLDAEAAEALRNLGYLAFAPNPAPRTGPRPDPKDSIELHVRLETARDLAVDRRHEEAIRVLKSVLEQDPDNLAALIDLAEALEATGDPEEAVRVAERALTLAPDYSRLYLLLATLEDRRGNPEQALRLIDLGLAKDQRHVEAQILKAYLLDRLQRPAEAEQVLRSALERAAENPRLNVVYAQMVEMRGGDVEAAVLRLRVALDRDPELSLGWRLLGDALDRLGRPAEALHAYRQGLEHRPDEPELHARRGLLLARQGKPSEAEQHLREAIRLDREPKPEVYVTLGACLAETGRLAEAVELYDRVLAAEPDHAAARNNRAIASFRLGRVQEAERELQSLLDVHPDSTDALNNLAAIRIEQGRWTEAAETARHALKLDPKLVEALNNLGIALQEQGQLADAERHFARALELDPGYEPARQNLGELASRRAPRTRTPEQR